MASMQLKSKNQLQNGTVATLNNQTRDEMQLIKHFSWAGDFKSTPKPIPGGSVGTFQHLNNKEEEGATPTSQGGSEGAVCYTITNSASADLAIVLAWSAPAEFNPSKSPNRVFGGVATKSVIDAMTEDQIQSLLANASCFVRTSAFGVSLEATIANNPATNMAELGVYFQLI